MNDDDTIESREVIEEKIFLIKQRMVDYTVKQWEILDNIKTLKADITVLAEKHDQLNNDQQDAIDAEDYEKADALDLKMKQVKELIESKEHQIKQLSSHNHGQESLKAEKL